MNILDKVIGWVSPERALNRIAAREAIRQYDAASMDRLSSDCNLLMAPQNSWPPVHVILFEVELVRLK